MRTISFRVDEHTDALLSAFCEQHGVSQTEALKAAITQLAVSQRPRPADLARDIGLIGSFRSTAGDLGEQHSVHLKRRLRAQLSRETGEPPAAILRRQRP